MRPMGDLAGWAIDQALPWSWRLELTVLPWFVLFEVHGRLLHKLTHRRRAPARRHAAHAR